VFTENITQSSPVQGRMTLCGYHKSLRPLHPTERQVIKRTKMVGNADNGCVGIIYFSGVAHPTD